MGVISQIRDVVLRPEHRAVLFLGGSDTGKTTQVWETARWLAERCTVGVVDADMGQSHIGPPTTIAWGVVKREYERWEDVEVRDRYFVGATSPQGNLLPTLTGVKLACDAAMAVCDKVLLDTTGLIARGPGFALKVHKVDLVRPDVIVALQQSGELEHILGVWKACTRPLILRIKPHKVKIKPREQRFRHREARFRAYFEGGRIRTVRWRQVGLCNVSPDQIVDTDYFLHRLVSLRDEFGKDVALGIIRGIDEEHEEFSILSPMAVAVKVSSVVFGGLRITPKGRPL